MPLARPLLIFAIGAAPLSAQQADVIRGLITGADGKPIENADITATSIPNNVRKVTTSGGNGRYTITFPNGDGDYWITVTAIGFSPRRFELKRVADEDVLVGDAKLTPSGVVLDAMRVQADRARASRNDQTDISGTEKTLGALSVDPAQAGNLAAMASSLPGVQLIPGADGNPDQFSVFGLGGDQNNATLNGFGFGGGDVPRDAATRSALSTSPWDVSRGGFSGAQFNLRTQSGSNFSSRGLSTLVNSPALQWTDRAGRSGGAQYSSLSVGASTSGALSTDRVFYSGGYQLDRRASDIQSLLTADGFALAAAGIARDSVNRLLGVLTGAGIPTVAAGMPTTRSNDRGLLLLAMDVAPPSSTSGQSINLTASGSFTRLSSPFGQVTSLATTDARNTSWFGAIQARHTNYFGFGVLMETSLGLSRSSTATDAYLGLPAATVRVGSALDDGSASIVPIALGGNASQNTFTTTTGIGAQNLISWFSVDSRHRIKLSTELRGEGFEQDLSTNRLGTFTYNSLGDLAANTPVSFSRLLSPRLRDGRQLVGAVSLGDSYRPKPDLQIQYGVRLDGNRYLTAPTPNAAIDQAFGADNASLPNRIYLSPRVGFSWTYGQAPQLAVASGFTRGPRAVLRGGVGLFQNASSTQLIGPALSNTGLAAADQQITCVGSAVPVPDWNAWAASAASIPTQCASGQGSFATGAPNVVLFDDDFRSPKSARANANWSGAVLGNRFMSTIDATYSLNLDQPSPFDLNFNPTTRFVLADEGDRPVFVPATSIVGSSGAIAVQGGRRSPNFARVSEIRSGLRSVNQQFTIGIRPAAFSSSFGWNLTYVYSNTRDRASGFVSTGRDPVDAEWGRSSLDSRHQVGYTLSYNLLDWFPLSLTGSFRAGRPFTPLIAGDINGDGYGNDRAFVFDPASANDPALASSMTALLAGGSAPARQCLSGQVGRVARRNSCQAPWTSTSTLVVAVNPLKLRLPQRLNIAFFVSNAVGAADLLLHGESKRRGWGQPAEPDQVLLFVRGFDPAAGRFRYEVNPRFGSTNPAQSLSRNPVVVTAQMRVDVGFTRERQLLSQSLDRGRVRPGARATDQELRGWGGTLIPANPMALILQQTDSLKLTRVQADSISTLNREFVIALDSIWTPVARSLADLPPEYDKGEAYDRYRAARRASVDILINLAPLVRGLMTPSQIRKLPATVLGSLDTRYLASVRSSTAGNANMGVLGMLAQMNGLLGADGSGAARTIMTHR